MMDPVKRQLEMSALALAKAMGLRTVVYTGNNGRKMRDLAEINVVVPSAATMNIQESHLALEHIFCMVVERCYFGPGFGETKEQA